MPLDVHPLFQKGKDAVEVALLHLSAMAFAVDEVAPAADRLPDQNIRQYDVQDLHERIAVLFCIVPGKQCTGYDAALNGQTAVPDADDLDWIGKIEFEIVEDAVPESGADDAHPQRVDEEGIKEVQ